MAVQGAPQAISFLIFMGYSGDRRFLRAPVLSMPLPLPGLRMSVATIAAALAFSSAASAQFAPVPARPAVAPPRSVTTPSVRAASCHNGASFERFLADLKQRAVADGVSQRAIAAASPYLTYDQ